jgi:glycosyltransferase involved in cell wall biosynthesis
LNVFPLASRPVARRRTDGGDRLTLYWFSQTIGTNRGLEDVVEAMGVLSRDAIELHLRGSWQNGYRNTLERLARDRGVTSDRIVSHAPGDPDEMVRLASEFDVGLATEPGATPNNDILLSNKIFTYLLAGAAVIATATTGQAAIASRLGGACVTYRPGDIDTLARQLHAWAIDRNALETARATAWQLAQAEYNWDREKEKFLDVVSGVLRTKAAVRAATPLARASA